MKTNDQNAWDSQDENLTYESGSLVSANREDGDITDRGFSDDLDADSELDPEDDELDAANELTDDELEDEDADLLDDDDDVPADTDTDLDEDEENRLDDTEGGGTIGSSAAYGKGL